MARYAKLSRLTGLGSIFLLMAGCAGTPLANGPTMLGQKDLGQRNSDAHLTKYSAVNYFSEKPVTVLYTSSNSSYKITTDAGDKVPDVSVNQINANPIKFGALLDQITAQVGMSWSIEGTARDKLMGEDVYYVQRNETMLKSVLEEIAEQTDSFYRVEGDRIVFSQDRVFTTTVPRMADSLSVIKDGITNAGGTDIFTDKLSGTITFRATRASYMAIRDLLKSFENGRDMIVYDFWLLDRQLSDNAGVGVDLKLSGTKGSTPPSLESKAANLIDALGAGEAAKGFVSGNLGQIAGEATLKFIRSLGDTQTVARPTISMLSGASSSFESGQKSQYIKSVNSTSSTSSNSVSSGTDVQTLDVGVKIKVEGAYNSGVISSDINIDVSELLSFDSFDTGDVTLKLPKTSQRKMDAHLEARPGDLLVLGGIIRDRDEKTQQNLAASKLPTSRAKKAEKTETIILVRPRLVQIRPGEHGQTGVAHVSEAFHRAPNPVANAIAGDQKSKRLIDELSNGEGN